MPDTEFPEWLDKTEESPVGILTLDDGSRMTVEIIKFDDERNELVVESISPDHSQRKDGKRDHAIPVSRIVSFEPQSRKAQPWPLSDPCRSRSFSRARFTLMTTLFLSLILGSLPLYFFLIHKPYGLQEASMIMYTIFAVFFTFARTGTRGGPDLRPYLFTCPAVEPQIPRMLWRHLGFLATLFALQTAALTFRPDLPDWWNVPDRKGGTPFAAALMLLCMALALAQVYTNRSLLDRAHRELAV